MQCFRMNKKIREYKSFQKLLVSSTPSMVSKVRIRERKKMLNAYLGLWRTSFVTCLLAKLSSFNWKGLSRSYDALMQLTILRNHKILAKDIQLFEYLSFFRRSKPSASVTSDHTFRPFTPFQALPPPSELDVT